MNNNIFEAARNNFANPQSTEIVVALTEVNRPEIKVHNNSSNF